MNGKSTIQRPIALEFDADAALEKALVRLAQAARPAPESFLALRAGALLFQVAGVGTVVAGMVGAIVLARSHLDDALGFPAGYLAVALSILSVVVAILLLAVGELLILQVAVAHSGRLTSVLLAEMNFADRAETAGRRPSTRRIPLLRGGGEISPTPPMARQRP